MSVTWLGRSLLLELAHDLIFAGRELDIPDQVLHVAHVGIELALFVTFSMVLVPFQQSRPAIALRTYADLRVGGSDDWLVLSSTRTFSRRTLPLTCSLR